MSNTSKVIKKRILIIESDSETDKPIITQIVKKKQFIIESDSETDNETNNTKTKQTRQGKNSTETEKALKTEISKQVRLKNYETKSKNYNFDSLLTAWKLIYKKGAPKTVHNMIWEHLENAPSKTFIKCQSADLNIYSTIGEYKTKSGILSPCHYTHFGKYIGSVKKFGDKPISYEGNFIITQEQFDIDIHKLPQITNFTDLFTPKKKVVEANETDNEEDLFKLLSN
tara:strand:- start:1390 stop:2070 length:681 start_codon:yes stop_codon:yes gene_type:complete